MSRCDTSPTRPLCVAIELAGSGHHPALADRGHSRTNSADDLWVDLTAGSDLDGAGPDQTSTVVRIQAADLRDAQRKTAAFKSDLVARGHDPASVTVSVDIEVMIAPDARTARAELARLDCCLEAPRTPSSLLYVGTPQGLAGLISDIHAVQVADGVTLLPLALPEVFGHIASESLPWLETLGVRLSTDSLNLVRQRGARQCDANRRASSQRRSQRV